MFFVQPLLDQFVFSFYVILRRTLRSYRVLVKVPCFSVMFTMFFAVILPDTHVVKGLMVRAATLKFGGRRFLRVAASILSRWYNSIYREI